MPLTFGEIKKLVAPYAGRAGKCADADGVSLFAKQVMEYLLLEGSPEAIRKICILAFRGCLSLPPEIETPLEAKIDRHVANVWNKWLTYHSTDRVSEQCSPIGHILEEDGTQTPLAYGLPEGGSVVGVMGECEESDDAFVIIQGNDPQGRPIFTMFDGEQIAGEKFRIQKNNTRYGQVVWGEITNVLKSRTNGYVNCYAVNPQLKTQRFLANWSPLEEKPMYRKYRVVSRNCPPIVHITMLARVRLRDNYHDNEVTFFDNSLAILLGAQRIQAEVNIDLQTAAFKKQGVEDILEKEAGYKKKPGGPVDMYFPLSGGSIRNIVSSGLVLSGFKRN